MKRLLISCFLFIGMYAKAQTVPVYLDETKPIEQRIDDALSRMTLDEKIRVIHALILILIGVQNMISNAVAIFPIACLGF